VVLRIFQFFSFLGQFSIIYTFKKRKFSPNVFLTTVRKFAKNNFTGSCTGNHPPGDLALGYRLAMKVKKVLKSFYNLATF
jgi:hypothetical protein